MLKRPWPSSPAHAALNFIKINKIACLGTPFPEREAMPCLECEYQHRPERFQQQRKPQTRQCAVGHRFHSKRGILLQEAMAEKVPFSTHLRTRTVTRVCCRDIRQLPRTILFARWHVWKVSKPHPALASAPELRKYTESRWSGRVFPQKLARSDLRFLKKLSVDHRVQMGIQLRLQLAVDVFLTMTKTADTNATDGIKDFSAVGQMNQSCTCSNDLQPQWVKGCRGQSLTQKTVCRQWACHKGRVTARAPPQFHRGTSICHCHVQFLIRN